MNDNDFIEGIHFYFDNSGLMAFTENTICKEDSVVATAANIVLTIMKM